MRQMENVPKEVPVLKGFASGNDVYCRIKPTVFIKTFDIYVISNRYIQFPFHQNCQIFSINLISLFLVIADTSTRLNFKDTTQEPYANYELDMGGLDYYDDNYED